MKSIFIFQDEYASDRDYKSQKSLSASSKQGGFRKPLTDVDINKIETNISNLKPLREISDTALGGKAGFLKKSKNGSWTKNSFDHCDVDANGNSTALLRNQHIDRSAINTEPHLDRHALVNSLGELVNKDLSKPVALASKDGDRGKVHQKRTKEYEGCDKDQGIQVRKPSESWENPLGSKREEWRGQGNAASSLLLSGSDFLKNLDKQKLKEPLSKPLSTVDQTAESLFQGSYDLSTSLSLLEKSKMDLRSNLDALHDNSKNMILENLHVGDQSNDVSFAIEENHDDRQELANHNTVEAATGHQVKEEAVMSDYYSLQDLDSTSETISVTISEMSNMTVDSCDISRFGSSPCSEDLEFLPTNENMAKMAGLGIKFKHAEGGSGFLVAAVVFNGPAQRAGIIPGEILKSATDKLIPEGSSAASLNKLVTGAGLKMYIVVKRRFQVIGIEISRYSEKTPLGFSFTDKDGKSTRISTVIHGSPAFKAGVLEGDELLAVDPMDVCDISRNELLSIITGPEGSSVLLGLQTRAFSRTRWVLVQRRSGVPLSVCEAQTIEPKQVTGSGKDETQPSPARSEGPQGYSRVEAHREDWVGQCVSQREAAGPGTNSSNESMLEEQQDEAIMGQQQAAKGFELASESAKEWEDSVKATSPCSSLSPGGAKSGPHQAIRSKIVFPETRSELPAALLDQPQPAPPCSPCIHSNITKVKDPLPARRAPPEPAFHASMLDPMKMAGARTVGAPQELIVPRLSKPQRQQGTERAPGVEPPRHKEQAALAKLRVADATREEVRAELELGVLEEKLGKLLETSKWQMEEEEERKFREGEELKSRETERRRMMTAGLTKEKQDLAMSLPFPSSHRTSPKSPKESLPLTSSLSSKNSPEQNHDQDKSSLSQKLASSLLCTNQTFQSELLRQQDMDIR